ncbi:MAG: ParB N-terminal domain-containing protein [Alphaproteobacteria bacterium]|nr:ParB N-terminal domain-containing protein [Alphaproteobacteria bacterium]
MNYQCLSSDIYHIKAVSLKKLEIKDNIYKKNSKLSGFDAVIFIDNDKVFLVDGKDIVKNSKDEDFIVTRIMYKSFNPLIGFFITLIKPIKRKYYVRNNMSFRVRFDKLLDANLTRGERNKENAYQWTNKRWQISQEEAKKRYEDLYNSIKNNGYDENSPMIVTLNRKFGVKDQILQGHHRIGICKELNVDEVNICFWTAPVSFGIFRLFIKKKECKL